MEVSAAFFTQTYRGLELYFCSEQCEQRFRQRPKLYIGDPQHGKAAKQQGVEIPKHRKIHLKLPDNAQLKNQLVNKLQSMMGVKQLSLFSDTLEIDYDLVEVSLDEIKHAIVTMELQLDQSLIDKLHDSLLTLSESTELDSLSHPRKDHNYH
jgi:YHS domain-containing protein